MLCDHFTHILKSDLKILNYFPKIVLEKEYIYMTGTLYCTAEIDTILYVNQLYSNKNKIK